MSQDTDSDDHSLELYYRFTEGKGSVVRDLSGCKRTGRITDWSTESLPEGSPLDYEDEWGTKAAPQYACCGPVSSESLVPSMVSPDGFTCECWLRLGSIGSVDLISHIASNIRLCLDAAGSLRVISDSASGEIKLNSDTRLQPDAWTHLVVTYDAQKTWRLYIGGKCQTSSLSLPLAISDEESQVSFFSNISPNDGTVYTEIRVWCVARSDSEIQASMKNPLPQAFQTIWRGVRIRSYHSQASKAHGGVSEVFGTGTKSLNPPPVNLIVRGLSVGGTEQNAVAQVQTTDVHSGTGASSSDVARSVQGSFRQPAAVSGDDGVVAPIDEENLSELDHCSKSPDNKWKEFNQLSGIDGTNHTGTDARVSLEERMSIQSLTEKSYSDSKDIELDFVTIVNPILCKISVGVHTMFLDVRYTLGDLCALRLFLVNCAAYHEADLLPTSDGGLILSPLPSVRIRGMIAHVANYLACGALGLSDPQFWPLVMQLKLQECDRVAAERLASRAPLAWTCAHCKYDSVNPFTLVCPGCQSRFCYDVESLNLVDISDCLKCDLCGCTTCQPRSADKSRGVRGALRARTQIGTCTACLHQGVRLCASA